MESFVLEDVEVHPGLNLVKREGMEVRLTPKETAVLLHLVRASEGIATRQQLLDSVWGDVIVREDAPTLAISRLRRALGDDRRNPRFIETLPKVGYRLLVSPGKPGSAAARVPMRPRRRVRWAPIVLGALLAVMTLLYLSVRSAYEDASTAGEIGQTSMSEQGSMPR